MLAEQLVSVIFIGLLSVVVAAGLGAAMSAYANITRQTTADNLLARSVELVSDELVYSLSVEGEGSFPAFVSASTRETMQFYSPDDGETRQGIMIAGATTATTLVPSQSGLVPSLNNLVYDKDTNTWTFDVIVREDAQSSPLAQASLTVKRIGS